MMPNIKSSLKDFFFWKDFTFNSIKFYLFLLLFDENIKNSKKSTKSKTKNEISIWNKILNIAWYFIVSFFFRKEWEKKNLVQDQHRLLYPVSALNPFVFVFCLRNSILTPGSTIQQNVSILSQQATNENKTKKLPSLKIDYWDTHTQIFIILILFLV